MRVIKCVALELSVLLVGAVFGVLTAAYQPELTKWIKGISGYVKVAEYRVPVFGGHLASSSHGIEYLKVNSKKISDDSFTLHLEFRVEGVANNIHDMTPLQHYKTYRYGWKGNSYILRVESLSEGLDGADIGIYQSNIEIGG